MNGGTDPEPDYCSFCGARLDLLGDYGWPHTCKETTYGTALSPLPFFPLDGS